ncbi:aldehyde dehydrogenase family protein, partial [Thermodesulfobacteriota bacterium]
MLNAIFSIPKPQNEPVYSYAPGSKERELIVAELKRQSAEQIEIPLIIGGEEITTGDTGKAVMPHDHGHVLATYHKAGKGEVRMAIEAASKAKKQWETLSWIDRASLALKAGELIHAKYRYI